jgi:hypothetical protein
MLRHAGITVASGLACSGNYVRLAGVLYLGETLADR